MSKNYKLRKKQKKEVLFLLSFGAFIFITISTVAYASLNTTLTITGEAFFRPAADIRITEAKINNTTNGGIISYDLEYNKYSISPSLSLPNLNSTVTYSLTITNFVDIPMKLTNIKETTSNSYIIYELNGIEIDDVFKNFGSTTFTITFKYDPSLSSLPSNTELNSTLIFDLEEYFPPVGIITYNYNTWTNNNVIASIAFNKEDVTITNNNGSNQYTFNENGTFEFEFKDHYGINSKTMVTVSWIDKRDPNIYQLNSNSTGINDISISGTSSDLDSGICNYAFSKDGGTTYSSNQSSPNYTFTNLSHNTIYPIKVKVIDCAGNINDDYIVNIKTDQQVNQIFYARVTSYENISNWNDLDKVLTNTTNTNQYAYREAKLCTAIGNKCKPEDTVHYTMSNIGTSNAYTDTNFNQTITIPANASITNGTVYFAFGMASTSITYSVSGPAEISGPITTQSTTINASSNTTDLFQSNTPITTLPTRGSEQTYSCYLHQTKTIGSGGIRLEISYIYGEFNAYWVVKGGIQ